MRLLRSTCGSESDLESSFRGEAEKCSKSDYYYAKNDAIVHEQHQAVAAEVAEKEGDDYRAQDGAQDGAHQERHFHIGRDATVFMDVPALFQRCRGDGRRGEQERKARGGLAIEAAEQSGDDGGPAARSTGNHR